MTPKEIAQYVIDDRYPKNENDKVSDVEMYHWIIENIKLLINSGQKFCSKSNCTTCAHEEKGFSDYPCSACDDSNHYKLAI